MSMTTDSIQQVPEDGLIPMLVTCRHCNGTPTLPSGQICQTCKGEGKLTAYVSVDALVRYTLNRLADILENPVRD